jgi:hypothetical protein
MPCARMGRNVKWPIPRLTFTDPPAEGQRVLYFFAPFGAWHVGEWDGGSHFTSRAGFCDWHDAPCWLPEPPSALDLIESDARRLCFTASNRPCLTDSGGLRVRANLLYLLAEHGRFRIVEDSEESNVKGYWPENDPAPQSLDESAAASE